MSFTHYKLGYQQRGATFEVTLSSGANVRLMDDSNFNSYRRGGRHTYHGGLVNRSPYRLTVPRAGNWHVTVDVQGLRNGTKSSIRQVAGALPLAPSEAPLSTVPSLVRNQPPATVARTGSHDVFISHASEDKDEVVRPLAEALREAGLSVWYDEFQLKIGDSLRQSIDAGLAISRFGVVVLSPSFISKGWTNYELDGIVSRSVNGEQVVLPIWHNLTKSAVLDFSPSLADKVARNTSSYTVQEIADEIAAVIRGDDGAGDGY